MRPIRPLCVCLTLLLLSACGDEALPVDLATTDSRSADVSDGITAADTQAPDTPSEVDTAGSDVDDSATDLPSPSDVPSDTDALLELPSEDTVEPPPEPYGLAVARYFAPIWYQDTANGGPDGLGAKADIPTTVDYDGDRQHNNNWENLVHHPALPAIYWSLVATQTHYYLTYAHYHPRDWEQLCTGLFTECHEGDLEEIQLVVQREDDGPGIVRVLRSHHHGHTSTWALDETIEGTEISIDGAFDFADAEGNVSPVQTENHHHVRIFAEAKGHGVAPCKAAENFFKPEGILFMSCPNSESGTFPGDDGLPLFPDPAVAPVIPAGQEATMEPATYTLVSMEKTLWQWRSELGKGALFYGDSAWKYTGAQGAPFSLSESIGGRFDADQFLNDASSGRAPWNLSMDGSELGDAFFDPAWAYSEAIDFPEEMSLVYTAHPYLPSVVDTPQ